MQSDLAVGIILEVNTSPFNGGFSLKLSLFFSMLEYHILKYPRSFATAATDMAYFRAYFKNQLQQYHALTGMIHVLTRVAKEIYAYNKKSVY